MKYEIINPSDRCYMSADEEIVAATAVLFLGDGKYGCKSIEGKNLPTMFIFGGDPDAVWKEAFGVGLEDFLKKDDTMKKLSSCFASFEYPNERTSMNNIGERAKVWKKSCDKKADPVPLTPERHELETPE